MTKNKKRYALLAVIIGTIFSNTLNANSLNNNKNLDAGSYFLILKVHFFNESAGQTLGDGGIAWTATQSINLFYNKHNLFYTDKSKLVFPIEFDKNKLPYWTLKFKDGATTSYKGKYLSPNYVKGITSGQFKVKGKKISFLGSFILMNGFNYLRHLAEQRHIDSKVKTTETKYHHPELGLKLSATAPWKFTSTEKHAKQLYSSNLYVKHYGSKKLAKVAKQIGSITTRPLFRLVRSNSSHTDSIIGAVTIDLDYFPQIKTLKGFAHWYREQINKAKSPYQKTLGSPQNIKLMGRDFIQHTGTISAYKQTTKYISMITIKKQYAIIITLNWSKPGHKKQMLKIVNSMQL